MSHLLVRLSCLTLHGFLESETVEELLSDFDLGHHGCGTLRDCKKTHYESLEKVESDEHLRMTLDSALELTGFQIESYPKWPSGIWICGSQDYL